MGRAIRPDYEQHRLLLFLDLQCNGTKARDIGSISVGNYAVNKHTADARAWQVSHDVSYGDDGVLVTTNEELRAKRGIDSTAIQQYRAAH